MSSEFGKVIWIWIFLQALSLIIKISSFIILFFIDWRIAICILLIFLAEKIANIMRELNQNA